MELLINNETTYEITIDLENLIEKMVRATIVNESLSENIEISFLFVDNEQIRKMNKRYRKLDKPTDVLSFPQLVPKSIIPDGETAVLGDIVISIEKAREQAFEYGHSFERELAFLIVHGVLHLLGYDHMDRQTEEEMFSKQKEILKNCGLS